MMELEKLKQLFFDKEQYFIFEHLPKPIIFDKHIYKIKEEDRFSKQTLVSHMENFWRKKVKDNRNQTLYEQALKKVMKKDCMDVIDDRLLSMLEGFS